MKSLLGTVGLGFLVCIPCLVVITGVSLAAFGGGLVALATSPGVQAAGVLVVIGGLAAAGWYARRRRACPRCDIERTRGGAPRGSPARVAHVRTGHIEARPLSEAAPVATRGSAADAGTTATAAGAPRTGA